MHGRHDKMYARPTLIVSVCESYEQVQVSDTKHSKAYHTLPLQPVLILACDVA